MSTNFEIFTAFVSDQSRYGRLLATIEDRLGTSNLIGKEDASMHHPLVTQSDDDGFFDKLGYEFMFWLSIFLIIWDAMFWNFLLSIPLGIALPFLAFWLLIDEEAVNSNRTFWSTIERWADSTTLWFWLPLMWIYPGFSSQKWLPFILFLQWFLMPINLIFGLITVVLFPLTIYAVYATNGVSVGGGEVVEIQGVSSAFSVWTGDQFFRNIDTACPGNDKVAGLEWKLRFSGYTKFTCVFGILVAGVSEYPDANLLYAANTLAKLMDKDCTGNESNFDSLRNSLQSGAWLNGGVSQTSEGRGDAIANMYGFGLQNWKGTLEEEMKQITIEEVFHMVHQYGWAKIWPSDFGVDDFTTSIVCREMASLQCVQPGWWHSENVCPSGAPFSPGNPASSPLEGTCNTANCDCVEFFHQAFLMSIGQTPGWLSEYMPQTQSATNNMLTTGFKNMIADSKFGLPTSSFYNDLSTNCYAGNGITFPKPE